MIHTGDCVEVMRELPADSIDAIVTDPPYGLEFMGREWDRLWRTDETRERTTGRQSTSPLSGKPRYGTAPATMQAWHEAWARAAFRVAKPGAHLLAFGGTRTVHRLAAAIEDAGWEIRDCLVWAYASGFPKSLAPYRSIMSGLCRYHDDAPHAVQVSAWHPHESPEGKEPIALALAETQPEGELALLIRTGAVDASPVVTATLLSAFLRGDTNWNTAWSWESYSAERWAKTSTFIIGLAIKAITHQGIWNSLASLNTLAGTHRSTSRPDGCECAVLRVVESLTDGSASTNSILWPSAHEPATSPLARLRGLGTAAKPAWEPIVMARKPLRGTVAANVLEHGTGALNIDATRIGYASEADAQAVDEFQRFRSKHPGGNPVIGIPAPPETGASPHGRWPANLILTDPIFDGDTLGVVGGGDAGVSTGGQASLGAFRNGDVYGVGRDERWKADPGYGDSGTYSRFFLIPKSSRSDREPLVRGETNGVWSDGREIPADYPSQRGVTKRANSHPTVKPLDLMRHLVRLVTPPGGTVLDCFLGSGTTAIAANAEGFRCIGIEKEREYLDIALARMLHEPLGLGLDVAAPTRKAPKGPFKEEIEERGYNHAVNDPAARSARNAMFSGLAGAALDTERLGRALYAVRFDLEDPKWAKRVAAAYARDGGPR